MSGDSLSLEKLEISKRLSGVESRLSSVELAVAVTNEHMAALIEQRNRCELFCQKMIEKHNDVLYGNSHDGIIAKVKSLEDSNMTRNRILAAILTICGGIGLKDLWELVKHHGN